MDKVLRNVGLALGGIAIGSLGLFYLAISDTPTQSEYDSIRPALSITDFNGVETRIYHDKNYPNKQYVDFSPFGELDLVMYMDLQSGSKSARNMIQRGVTDSYYFGALQEKAREEGLIN